ncbi:MAG TPA: FMN-binding protein [Longimicrobiales bacterium]|nr:FMN-binding protein [Longimicrobiales bacterium]
MLSGTPAHVHAQAPVTQDEALRSAFPAPLRVERRTAYLDRAQLQRASALAGHAVTQSVVNYYVAVGAHGATGIAYFDGHRVRTHGEVLMFVVDTDARIRHTEVLVFAEPPEYRAPHRWLDLFAGRSLSPELSHKRGIPNISGATLTAQAVTNAARRVLALHQVIDPFGSP